MSEKSKVVIITALISAATIIIPSLVTVLPIMNDKSSTIDSLSNTNQDLNKIISLLQKPVESAFAIKGQLTGSDNNPISDCELYAAKCDNVQQFGDDGKIGYPNLQRSTYKIVIVDQNKKAHTFMIYPENFTEDSEHEFKSQGIYFKYNFKKEQNHE